MKLISTEIESEVENRVLPREALSPQDLMRTIVIAFLIASIALEWSWKHFKNVAVRYGEPRCPNCLMFGVLIFRFLELTFGMAPPAKRGH